MMTIFLPAIILAVGGVSPRRSLAQAPPSEALASLSVITERFEQIEPRPAKISATNTSGNGYWESQDLNVARYGTMRLFLPVMRSVHPSLIAYWLDRTEERDCPEGIERDKDGHYRWAFGWKAFHVVASIPGLSPWADQLQTASDSLIQGVREASWISTDDVSDVERAVNLRKLDMEGRRLALSRVIQGLVAAAGDLNPQHNMTWKPLYEFLSEDVETQWTRVTKERDKQQGINSALSMTYWNAHEVEVKETTEQVEKLVAVDRRMRHLKARLLEDALAPGRTPMVFLETGAGEFIDACIEFDRELVRTLDMTELKANPKLAKALCGLFDVWECLQRREEFLRIGRGSTAVNTLMEVSFTVFKAESWAKADNVTAQRAGQTTDQLYKLKENWVKQGTPQGPMYAAVEVDETGGQVWTFCNWTQWKWITADELDDLIVDGRVLDGLGRRWLLPAGSPIKSIHSLDDVKAAGAYELVVGLDPAGAWAGIGEDSK
jgi:hypothetical protein